MIIGINGKIGSGKDAIGEIIQGLCLTNKNQTFEIKKFAGKLKQIGSLLTSIPVEKFEDQEFKKLPMGLEWEMTYREFLQKLGTEAMRDGLHTNVWVNALFADYKLWSDGRKSWYPNWIITDMRFPNEMEAVEEKEGITIRVTRPDFLSFEAMLHPSETALDDAKFDYEIINDGTIEDLVDKVREILDNEGLI
jgi:hypothetical protein